jgi:hypothetical protein
MRRYGARPTRAASTRSRSACPQTVQRRTKMFPGSRSAVSLGPAVAKGVVNDWTGASSGPIRGGAISPASTTNTQASGRFRPSCHRVVTARPRRRSRTRGVPALGRSYASERPRGPPVRFDTMPGSFSFGVGPFRLSMPIGRPRRRRRRRRHPHRSRLRLWRRWQVCRARQRRRSYTHGTCTIYHKTPGAARRCKGTV